MLPLATHQIPRFGTLPGMEDRGDIELGRKIRTLRKERGAKIADLAAAVGVSRGHLNLIELGRRGASMEVLVSLAVELGETLDFLASRDGKARDREAKNDFEAAWLLVSRSLPPEEAELELRRFMVRLKGILKTS